MKDQAAQTAQKTPIVIASALYFFKNNIVFDILCKLFFFCYWLRCLLKTLKFTSDMGSKNNPSTFLVVGGIAIKMKKFTIS